MGKGYEMRGEAMRWEERLWDEKGFQNIDDVDLDVVNDQCRWKGGIGPDTLHSIRRLLDPTESILAPILNFGCITIEPMEKAFRPFWTRQFWNNRQWHMDWKPIDHPQTLSQFKSDFLFEASCLELGSNILQNSQHLEGPSPPPSHTHKDQASILLGIRANNWQPTQHEKRTRWGATRPAQSHLCVHSKSTFIVNMTKECGHFWSSKCAQVLTGNLPCTNIFCWKAQLMPQIHEHLWGQSQLQPINLLHTCYYVLQISTSFVHLEVARCCAAVVATCASHKSQATKPLWGR